MRRSIVLAVVAGGVFLAPAALTAQAKGGAGPSHEFGVDLSAVYTKLASGCTTNCGMFTVMTPVDVRIGFLVSAHLSVEPRFTLGYRSYAGSHLLDFVPGFNLLYRLGPGTAKAPWAGPYVTGGVAYEMVQSGGSGSSATATQVSLNVGIGQRVAWGTVAFRPELFGRYNAENRNHGVPASYEGGIRVGISVFQ